MADSNKTEQASPRKQQKAREKGQIARSRDLMSSLAVGTMVLLFASQAPAFAAQWRALLSRSLDAAVIGDLSQTPLLTWTGLAVVRAISLTVWLSWMAAMLGALAQGGLVFAPTALQPNFSRLSPASRMEQLFSLPSVGRLLKSLLPGAAIIYLAVGILSREWNTILGAAHFGINRLVAFLMGHIFELAWKCALVLLVWSGADYAIEKHKLGSDLRMSKQDQRDEYKETEGNPATKARIRRLQRQVRRRKMLQDVQRASVVMTNPYAFRGRARIPPGHGGSGGGGQRPQPAGGADQAGGALARHSAHGEPASGARPVSLGADWAGDSGKALRRGGGDSGVIFRPDRCRRTARAGARPWRDKKPSAASKKRAADWALPVAAVALVFVMLVPLPAICSICCWRSALPLRCWCC